jgi:biotin carboxyl carrier protein
MSESRSEVFEVELGGRSRLVTVKPEGRMLRVSFDGHSALVDAERLDPWTLSLVFEEDRASYEVGVAQTAIRNEFAVHMPGGVLHARIGRANHRNVQARRGESVRAGRQQIISPMPGRVLKVMVAPGDEVKVRQGLVVVEAMKMENEIKSSTAGVVKDVLVTEGMSVEAGRLLVVVE